MNRYLLLVALMVLPYLGFSKDLSVSKYEEALELIHAYSGSGDELERANKLIEELSKSQHDSGLSQTLMAEILSTWQLSQDGEPVELRNEIIKMTDDALALNPKLGQAHVAKGRALLRASHFSEANAEIDKALKLDPKLSGAIFLKAEFYRRTKDIINSDSWYHKFINSTSSLSRRSNGYYWLGKVYEDASYEDEKNVKKYVLKAKDAYQHMVDLDPNGAWKNVNFAIFLNDYIADFINAEKYAEKALSLMEFPMARYHLAAAKYQQLGADLSKLGKNESIKKAQEISTTTNISLNQAVGFSSFSSLVQERLLKLQQQLK